MDINELIDQYYQKIYKLSLFYLKNTEEAQDMVQEIFHKALRNQSGFKGDSSPYTWLYRIAINTLLNHIKRKKILQFISFESSGPATETQLPDPGGTPEQHLEEQQQSQQELRKLQQALDKLSSREKTAFYLYHYDQIKQKQIARIMETSISAVEALLHKGMKKIRKYCAD